MSKLSPGLTAILDAVRAQQPVSVTGTSGAMTSFALCQLQQQLGRPMLIVLPTVARAIEVAQGLKLYTASKSVDMSPVVLLEGADKSPYQQVMANHFVAMERLAGLYRLVHGLNVDFIVASPAALSRRSIPRELLESFNDALSVNAQVDRDDLIQRLDNAGYSRVSLVEDPGTYAVRGSIIDVFSPVYLRPVRIDFFDDVVESLRFFSASTQRSGKRVKSVWFPPAHEVLLTPALIERARVQLRHQAADNNVSGPRVRALMAELEDGIRPPGLQACIPAFYEMTSQVTDYLPDDAVVCAEDPDAITAALEQVISQAQTLFTDAVSQGRIVYQPEDLYVAQTPPWAVKFLTLTYEEDCVDSEVVDLIVRDHTDLRRELQLRRGDEQAFAPVAETLRSWMHKGLTAIALGSTRGQVERLHGLFSHYDVPSVVQKGALSLERISALNGDTQHVHLFVGELSHGFVFESMQLAILGSQDVFSKTSTRKQRERGDLSKTAVLRSFRSLKAGDFVVHVDHGIGRYDGLVKLEVGDTANDFLRLMYRDDNLLYVPVQRLDRVQKYVAGEDSVAVLDRLGSVAWETTKKKARKAAKDMAKELLAIHAARLSRTRSPYTPRSAYYDEFCTSFPYTETPDQARAIDDVMKDLDIERPMDRLVCGDVGYGKTEVAVRAAFRAVLDSKQVAILVPTTVLAEQHRLTFEDRFRGYPVSVGTLSRFRSRKEISDLLVNMRRGVVDVIIGTHRLLQKDVEFRNLGLLVIDEEHRFGVRHKERIKQMKSLVDVLTLTATPIPRTLNMALAGIRDLSIIASPPVDRLSIRTYVSRDSDEIIQDAVQQELRRGGQVFFVHNRVETIERVAERLRRLAPNAKVLVAHGQMAESTLERVMLSFMAGHADILVCTTIVESGLDVPRANTMLVHKAERLGLAQLYQLRGRIGRSNRRAYCHLLIPEISRLTGQAKKRLQALQRFSDLGSGFNIATLDLEIRGGGNLLGSKQAGHVKAVGMDFFGELLADAVSEMKGDTQEALEKISCEMKVGLPAFLPEKYVPDVSLRLALYKEIASVRTHDDLAEAFEDLVDRCGRPPEEARNLFAVTHLKIDCQRLGMSSLTYNRGGLVLALDKASPLAGSPIVHLVQQPNCLWKLTPNVELVRVVSDDDWHAGLKTAHNAVNELLDFASKTGLC